MSALASQITSLPIVYSTVYSRSRSKKTLKLRVTGLCVGNSPVTGEFPAQRASNAENVSIWWRHHVYHCLILYPMYSIRRGHQCLSFRTLWIIWYYLMKCSSSRKLEWLKHCQSRLHDKNKYQMNILIFIVLINIFWTITYQHSTLLSTHIF